MEMDNYESNRAPTVPDWDTFCRIAFSERFALDRAEFIRKLREAEEAPEPETHEEAA